MGKTKQNLFCMVGVIVIIAMNTLCGKYDGGVTRFNDMAGYNSVYDAPLDLYVVCYGTTICDDGDYISSFNEFEEQIGYSLNDHVAYPFAVFIEVMRWGLYYLCVV